MTPSNRLLLESHRHCGFVARRQARNFYPSFLLLPAEGRRSMCALYAFLRHSDDIADEPGAVAAKHAQLEQWRSGLLAAVAGSPPLDDWPGWPALADTVARHEIPARYLLEVLDGVAMDLEPQPFATFEALHAYCYRVASAVGLCCLHIWGFRSENGRAESLAEETGLALQLTNILRDVGEDARNGRVYLPIDELERADVSRDDLLAAQASPRLRELLRLQAERARGYYQRSAGLVDLVDPGGRPVLLAIVGIYRALLEAIEERDFEVLASRVSVPTWRKGRIVVGALASRLRPWRSARLEAGRLP